MASTKDEFLDVRPANRPASVHANARPHAHSVSLGVLNNAHRVNRRKSSSSLAGVNMAAISAAAKEAGPDGPIHTPRTKLDTSDGLGKLTGSNASNAGRPKSSTVKGSAILDGPPLSSIGSDKTKARARRASEGSRLARGERTRSNAGELRCEKCGKGYKHGSCLTKHLWEHTPEWNLTSKLLISKHQQVQLLEAASVLMSMNTTTSAANESAIQESESSGESPAASGISDHQDDESSRTSTPSQESSAQYKHVPPVNRPSRQDSYNSAFSRSFASTSGHSFAASSAPTEPSDMFWYRSASSRRRPSTSSQSHYSSDGQADVAAAAEGLVSCSLGTPKNGATQLADDIPPVPPLPAQFAQHASRPVSLTKGYQADVEMHEVPEHEEDDGVFGHMER